MRSDSSSAPASGAMSREIRTVVVLDVVESVRLMQHSENEFIARWRELLRQVREQLLPRWQGRMVKSLGDGMLLEFESTRAALGCALATLQTLGEANRSRPGPGAFELRGGLHRCEVVHDELDIYGSGVNLAARLTTLALPGGLVGSSAVRETLLPGLDAEIEDLGDCWLKSLDEPQRVWRLRAPNAAAAPRLAPGPAAQPLDRTDMRASIAVLPLRCLDVAPAARHLGVFVAEELIGLLSRQPLLAVTSSLSSQQIDPALHRSAELQQALGVRYLTHGSCLMNGDRLHLHLELVDASAGGGLVWAHSAKLSLAALLADSGAALAELAAELSGRLIEAESRRAESFQLPNLESYSLLFGAITRLHRLSRGEFMRAQEMLEALRDRHPRSPIPRAWLGKWHVMRIGQGWSPDPAADGRRALDHTASALDLQPGYALSLTLDGFASAYLKRDFERAEQRYEQALAANPSESLTWLFRAAMLGYREQHEEARASIAQALALSPLDPMRYYYEHFASLVELLAGDTAASVRWGERSLRHNRTHASTLRILVIALALDGQVDEARRLGRELLALEPGLNQARFRARFPGHRPAQVDRLVAALDLAGIPAG